MLNFTGVRNTQTTVEIIYDDQGLGPIKLYEQSGTQFTLIDGGEGIHGLTVNLPGRDGKVWLFAETAGARPGAGGAPLPVAIRLLQDGVPLAVDVDRVPVPTRDGGWVPFDRVVPNGSIGALPFCLRAVL